MTKFSHGCLGDHGPTCHLFRSELGRNILQLGRRNLTLADEPTANVDPGNQKQIVELIRETCSEENVTLVMVTHAMEVASQFSRTVRLEEINRATAETQQGDLSSNDNTVTGVP